MLHALLLSALLSGQTADTLTTVALLARPGYHEGNRLLPSAPTGIVMVKAGMTTGVVVYGWKIRKAHPKAAAALFLVGAVSGSLGAVLNARHLQGVPR